MDLSNFVDTLISNPQCACKRFMIRVELDFQIGGKCPLQSLRHVSSNSVLSLLSNDDEEGEFE